MKRGKLHMKNKKKQILFICLLLLAGCFVVVNLIKNYSPIDVLEIQERTLRLTTGEKIQLTVKGYKYIDDKGNKKEVDISKLPISWNTSSRQNAFKVHEDGTLDALTTGIGNAQAVYKNKIYSRPITVWVFEENEDADNDLATYVTDTKEILEILKYEEITSIRILRSSSSSSSIMNEDDYILTNDEMIEFFECFKETSLKEVKESYPASKEPEICYDIYMYDKDGDYICLMMLENNDFLAFMEISNAVEDSERIAGWYEIVNTRIDKFIEGLDV